MYHIAIASTNQDHISSSEYINKQKTYITSLDEYYELIIQHWTKCSVNQTTILPITPTLRYTLFLVTGGRLAHGHRHHSLDGSYHSPTLPPTIG